jgi:callose synthase
MVREMDEILRQENIEPANSCNSENGVSFLDQVISPLYEVVAAVCNSLCVLYLLT